jgi:hypothetical protein
MFNELSISKVLLAFGMFYTAEDKSRQLTSKLRPIWKVTFLKRRFNYSKDVARWTAPLDLETIKETLNWTKKGVDSDEITKTKVENSYLELALHGKQVFSVMSKQISRAYRQEFNVDVPGPNYDVSLRSALDCVPDYF